MKKHEDRLFSIEQTNTQHRDHLNQLDQAFDASQSHSKEALDDLESKLAQLSTDLQSKTNDLYEELQDLQGQLENQPPRKEEQTPERKSKPDMLSAVKASLEEQIQELKVNIDSKATIE